MTPSPITPSYNFVIKNRVQKKSSGLGITVGTDSVTFTDLQVGIPFVINVYAETTLISSATFKGATVIQQLDDLSGREPSVTLVGTATETSVTATFDHDIGSNYYLFTAYQVVC